MATLDTERATTSREKQVAGSKETRARQSRSGVAKVTVNLPEDMAASLKELADGDGKTFTQALKEAISLKLFVEELFDEGAKLLIERKDKTIERIVFH